MEEAAEFVSGQPTELADVLAEGLGAYLCKDGLLEIGIRGVKDTLGPHLWLAWETSGITNYKLRPASGARITNYLRDDCLVGRGGGAGRWAEPGPEAAGYEDSQHEEDNAVNYGAKGGYPAFYGIPVLPRK